MLKPVCDQYRTNFAACMAQFSYATGSLHKRICLGNLGRGGVQEGLVQLVLPVDQALVRGLQQLVALNISIYNQKNKKKYNKMKVATGGYMIFSAAY